MVSIFDIYFYLKDNAGRLISTDEVANHFKTSKTVVSNKFRKLNCFSNIKVEYYDVHQLRSMKRYDIPRGLLAEFIGGNNDGRQTI